MNETPEQPPVPESGEPHPDQTQRRPVPPPQYPDGSGYPPQPGYQQQPGNQPRVEPQPGYQPQSGFEPRPGYQPQPGYATPPPYPNSPGGYQQGQSPEQQQGGYPRPYPGEPMYPGAGNHPGYPAQPPAQPQGIRISLGARARRRPEARAGVSIAVAGAALVLIGALVWTAGYYGSGVKLDFDENSGRPITSGEGRRFLGAGVFAVLAVLGYGVAVRKRVGPLASAGAVLGAISIPLVLGFVTLSLEDATRSGEPFSIDAVFLVSILAWAASYIFVPGMRGRSFLLTTAAITFANYVAFKAASTEVLRGVASTLSDNRLGSDNGTSTIATIGIAFGLVYYAISALLDRSGRHGTATATAAAALYTTAFGIAAASIDLGITKTGIVLVLIGALLALYGGYFCRRATTWLWSFGFLLGIILIVGNIGGLDNYAAVGLVFMLLGALIAGGAYVGSTLRHEAPDIVEDETPARALV